MKPRPQILKGSTYRIPSPVGTVFTTVNRDGDNPFEVFVTVGKSGSEVTAMAEAIGRLISLYLRSVDGSPRDRLVEVVGQLKDIGGRSMEYFEEEKVYSAPDAIAIALAKDLEIWDGGFNQKSPDAGN